MHIWEKLGAMQKVPSQTNNKNDKCSGKIVTSFDGDDDKEQMTAGKEIKRVIKEAVQMRMKSCKC